MSDIALQAFDGWVVPNARIPAPAAAEVALSSQQYRFEIASSTKLSGPSGAYNCFGLVFASRRTNVNVPIAPCSIDEVLQHDAYGRVAAPRVGDVVIYRDDAGEIEHAGIIVKLDGILPGGQPVVRVWSMWGGLGEFEHGESACPYRGAREYWRPRR